MKLTKLRPVGGFCAETAGAITLFLATFAGIPVSTTHTITGAIVGVGSATPRSRRCAGAWPAASSGRGCSPSPPRRWSPPAATGPRPASPTSRAAARVSAGNAVGARQSARFPEALLRGLLGALELFDERGAIEAEQLGGGVAVAAGALEGLIDQGLLDAGDDGAQVDAFGGQLRAGRDRRRRRDATTTGRRADGADADAGCAIDAGSPRPPAARASGR